MARWWLVKQEQIFNMATYWLNKVLLGIPTVSIILIVCISSYRHCIFSTSSTPQYQPQHHQIITSQIQTLQWHTNKHCRNVESYFNLQLIHFRRVVIQLKVSLRMFERLLIHTLVVGRIAVSHIMLTCDHSLSAMHQQSKNKYLNILHRYRSVLKLWENWNFVKTRVFMHRKGLNQFKRMKSSFDLIWMPTMDSHLPHPTPSYTLNQGIIVY